MLSLAPRARKLCSGVAGSLSSPAAADTPHCRSDVRAVTTERVIKFNWLGFDDVRQQHGGTLDMNVRPSKGVDSAGLVEA